MANINKIKISGTTYNIEDASATKTVKLTQAQYDALVASGAVDTNSFYVITDAEYFDPSNYVTSAQTEDMISAATSGKTNETDFAAHSGNTNIHVTTAQTAAWNAKVDTSDLAGYATSGYVDSAVSGKQDTLISGTNIKTINNQSILGSGNISIQAGGISSVEADYDNSAQPNGEFDIVINDGSSYSQIFIVGDGLQVTEEYGNTILSATGGGISSGEVQTMIDSSISGKTNQSDFSTHTANTTVHVTAQDKTNWNAKSDFSGSYNDLTDKPTLFSGSYNDLTDKPTIPTSASQLTNDAGYATSGYVDSSVSGKVSDVRMYQYKDSGIRYQQLQKSTDGTNYTDICKFPIINNKEILSTDDNLIFNLVETSAVTSAITSASTNSQVPSAKAAYNALTGKQDTLSAGTNITIVDNVISAEGGGGKAVSAGTNISITTGETADTINCTIPAYFHTNTIKGDIDIGSNEGVSSDYGRLIIGRRVQSRGNPYFQYSIGIGVQPDNSNNYCQLYGQNSVGIGRGFKIGSDSLYANGINNAVAIGHNATSRSDGDVTLGASTTASGGSSVAIGSGATANGSDYKMNLNNQIKVTPTNQVYISNSANTSTYCVQEKIETTEAALGGLKLVKLTQSAYDALSPDYDANTLYVIVN